ncbi:hypothetical protein GCM10020255_027430 [Rhodococcus baikonurensis]
MLIAYSRCVPALGAPIARPSITSSTASALISTATTGTSHFPGKGLLVVLHLALRADRDIPVVFFDSGLEYPETLDHIRTVAEQWNLDLHRIAADPPLLDALVDSGSWDHDSPAGPLPDLHDVLIGAPSRKAHQLLGPGELWGVRADESAGRRVLYARAQTVDGVISRADGTVAYGPIWNWSTADVWSYIRRHDLPVNPSTANSPISASPKSSAGFRTSSMAATSIVAA